MINVLSLVLNLSNILHIQQDILTPNKIFFFTCCELAEKTCAEMLSKSRMLLCQVCLPLCFSVPVT